MEDQNREKLLRSAVVTGGGSGIGRGICQRFANDGFNVAVADLNTASAQETVDLISANGIDAVAVPVNVTDKSSVENAFGSVLEAFGRIDVLVNCAGMVRKEYVWELEERNWDLTLALNLKGVFLCIQAAIGPMKAQQYGRIVNMSSIAGKTGEPRTGSYSASKFGVIGLTQSAALELAPYGVTVNAVCPAAVETELVRAWIESDARKNGTTYEHEMHEQIVQYNPVGRIGQVEDVAHAVAFLADHRSGFITGSTINVAGGREMH